MKESIIIPSLYRLFDNLIEGVMVLDADSKIVYNNPRACQILRCGNEVVRGRKIDEVFEELSLIDESKRQLTITILGYVEQKTEIKNATMAFKTIYGTHGNLALSFFPLDNTGLWILSFLDITEVLRDKLHRTRFVRAIGHELKHPLSSLKAYIYMIRKRMTNVEEKTQQYLKQADEQIDVLTAMLNDLTDISKISLQEFEVVPERQLLMPLIKQIADDFKVANTAHVLKVKTKKTDITASIDAIRFRQVLNNILSNAVRYSDPQTVISISIVEEKDKVGVVIRDEGEGISADDLEKIFDPYFRTKKGYQHKGLGLGLYISKEIMRRHGGSIQVDSKKGSGTTVTLWLPK